MPPIYQPEIPAEAVYWAAHHRRRELWVGYSAVQAILGNKLAPSVADWYLARTGFSGQQVEDLPVGPDRPDNLFEPLPEQGRARTGSSTTRPSQPQPAAVGATHRPLVRSAALSRGRRRGAPRCDGGDERSRPTTE